MRALPDEPGKRFETVDGELLVSPSPRYVHQRVVGLLHALLLDYCRRMKSVEVLLAPADVELDEYTLVQPDLFVLPVRDGRKATEFSDVGELLLAIEVLSPGTMRHDRVVKRPRYQRARAEYWIVDADARLVERWLPGDERPEMVSELLIWSPAATPESLTIDLPMLFAEAVGDL